MSTESRESWSQDWLAFELLRRLPGYQAAWADYQAKRDPDPHGWDAIVTSVADPARKGGRRAAAGSDLHSRRWSEPFGLQYMLDPARDAGAHGHVPWMPGVGRVLVDIVRSGSSFVFHHDDNPPAKGGHRRFVALWFDTEAPIRPQTAEAELLLESMANGGAKATMGRSPKDIVKALDVLDMKAAGASNAAIGACFSPDAADPADSGAKNVKRAWKLARDYRAVALGGRGVDN